MNPRLRERLKTKGMLAPADISRAGLLPEMAQDAATPSEPAEWDVYAPTSAPPMVEAQRAPLSPPDTAPAAQSAADSKPPTDKERLRAFLLQRVTGAADAPAPESDAERSAKFSDAVAPGLNRISAGMWARLGDRAPSQLPANTAAPYQAGREKLNDYLRAQMATKTGVAQQLYGDMTAEETASATQAQAKARQDATDKQKGDEFEETKRHNRAMEGIGGTKAEADKTAADAKAKKAAGGTGDPTYAAMPGYVHDPKVGVQKEEAQKLRDAVAEKQVLDSSIDKLMTLVRKHGIEVMPDNVKAQMQGLLKDIQLQAKGPAMYQLGVLSGPDMAILEQVTGDPTSWKSTLGGSDGVLTRLGTMKSQAQSRLDAKLNVRGYSATAPAVPTRGMPTQFGAGLTTLIDKDGTEFDVESSRVPAILKARPSLEVKK